MEEDGGLKEGCGRKRVGVAVFAWATILRFAYQLLTLLRTGHYLATTLKARALGQSEERIPA